MWLERSDACLDVNSDPALTPEPTGTTYYASYLAFCCKQITDLGEAARTLKAQLSAEDS